MSQVFLASRNLKKLTEMQRILREHLPELAHVWQIEAGGLDVHRQQRQIRQWGRRLRGRGLEVAPQRTVGKPSCGASTSPGPGEPLTHHICPTRYFRASEPCTPAMIRNAARRR